MKILKSTLLFCALSLFAFPPPALNAQGQSTEEIPKLFLDCDFCFENYIRENITLVNFMRDKEDADIHLLITRARTGSGGTEFTLKFLGRKDFESMSDTLTYTSAESDTQDETRRGLVRYVSIGLVPFLSNTNLVDQIDLSFQQQEYDADEREREDKWNNWVFDVNADFSARGESQQQSYEIRGGLSASRVTKDWKIDLDTDYNYEEDHFEFGDSTGTRTIVSTSTRQSFDGLVVKSINQHWSAGLSTDLSSSSFSNIKVEAGGSPTLEYNIFPYQEYNRHEFRIQYRITPTYFEYRDTTIFNKLSEYRTRQSLEAAYEVTETWGEINASLEGSHFLKDFSQNRLELEANVEFRIFRGLSLDLRGEYSLINDQIALPKADFDEQEVLLRRRELATDFSYRLSVGISYTFGSIYNNIVNPRFGGGGRRFF